MALTDISGIGSKTAEKIRAKGITTKDELLRAYKNNDDRIMGRSFEDPELNKRALDGIRDALFEQEQTFTDPIMGVEVGPENRMAAQKLGTKTLGDLPSVDVTQAKAGTEAEFTADTMLGELAEPAAEGELGEEDAPQSVIGWAADTAANLGVSDLSSGEIQDVNRLQGADSVVTTSPGQVYGGKKNLPDEATRTYAIDAKEVARAENIHEGRSEKAQRVDERKQAPVTDEITKWEEDPSHYDYPGVDTRASADEFFASKRKSSRGGLGSREVKNKGDETLRSQLEDIQNAGPEVQEELFGEPVEFNISNLFSR